ncbi:hypothetical protein Tco_1270245 [Tanacetum coccineum]
MPRCSKHNTRVPLKLIDTVYSTNGKMSNKKNETTKTKRDNYSNGVYGDDDDCYVNSEANGVGINQDKDEESSMKRDEVYGNLGGKIGTNCEQMSNGGSKEQSSDDHQADKERSMDNNDENNTNATSLATANANPDFVSNNASSSIYTNSVNMDSYAKAVGINGNDLDKNLFFVPTGTNVMVKRQ